MAKIEGIPFIASGRFRQGRRGHAPTLVVIHWSAGWGDADDIGNYFVNPMSVVWVLDKDGNPVLDEQGKPKTIKKPRQASYHFAIGRDGKMVQLVDTVNTAWHAGGGVDFDGKRLINERSIGICLANRGPLYKDPKWTAAHPDRVFHGKHSKPGFDGYGDKFEEYTEAQFTTLKELLHTLVALHPTLAFVIGHEDVTQGKGDPGPQFAEVAMDWGSLGLVRRIKDWRTKEWYDLGAL